MLVVFRADANPTIGSGHVIRCLALAQALRERDASCHFFCRSKELGALGERIKQEGHELHSFPEGNALTAWPLAHSAWLPHGQQFDASTCLNYLTKIGRPDWLVVDHYALDKNWEGLLRRQVGRILAIDDLADRQHDCDLLLDQNLRPAIDGNPYQTLTPVDCQHLLGPRFALLRSEFFSTERSVDDHDSPRLLIMFGGADQDNLTARVLHILAALDITIEIDVVTGPLYPYGDSLIKTLSGFPGARWHHTPGNIAQLMAKANFAVGSPGTTSWERCAMRLPTISLAVADNQVPLAQELARLGAHLYLGRADQVTDSEIAAALHLMSSNSLWREALANVASSITDGKGALRVAKHMCAQDIRVREASAADAQLIHRWRNDPRTRNQSFNSTPIPLEEHLVWYANALSDPARCILIGLIDDGPIGCVRFDLAGNEARTSIFLDPTRQGEGLASPLLLAAEAWLASHHPGIIFRRAEVLAGNTASRRAFESAGYQLEHSVFVKRG